MRESKISSILENSSKAGFSETTIKLAILLAPIWPNVPTITSLQVLDSNALVKPLVFMGKLNTKRGCAGQESGKLVSKNIRV